MRTWSGRESLLDAERPNPVDLVVQMGRIQRFGGAGKPDWTVLHHSMLVALIWLRLRPHYDWPLFDLPAALLHDTHEGVMGCDIPGPVKRALGEAGRDAVRGLENAIDEKIQKYLHISGTSIGSHAKGWYAPKLCDRIALIIEEIHFGPPNIVRDDVEQTISHSDFRSKEDAISYLINLVRFLHEIDPEYGRTYAEAIYQTIGNHLVLMGLICNCRRDGYTDVCPMNLDETKRERK